MENELRRAVMQVAVLNFGYFFVEFAVAAEKTRAGSPASLAPPGSCEPLDDARMG